MRKAFHFLGFKAELCADAASLKKFDKLVLPGVGAFGDGMNQLNLRGFSKPLCDLILNGKPLLGICLGLQLLFDSSEETPGIRGLGLVKGKVRKLKCSFKIPHMGWNRCEFKGQWPFHVEEQYGYYYFVHSYCADLENESAGMVYSDYGERFVAGFNTGNIWAMQFHPEKSQENGLNLIRKWATL